MVNLEIYQTAAKPLFIVNSIVFETLQKIRPKYFAHDKSITPRTYLLTRLNCYWKASQSYLQSYRDFIKITSITTSA